MSKALSIADFLRGIAKTHEKIIEKTPEAQKVPTAKRQQTQGMTPAEVADFYTREELLGKTETGEPFAVDLFDMIKSQPASGSQFPVSARFRFFPQSELSKAPSARTHAGYFSADVDRFMNDPVLYPGVNTMLQHLREKQAKSPLSALGGEPLPIHLGTISAPRGIGGQGYQMAYDAIRGAGGLNVADVLTSRNVLRRPLNVANTYYSRGNFENVLPISERGTGFGSESLNTRVMGLPGDFHEQNADVREYLRTLFGFEDPGDPRISRLMGLGSGQAAIRSLANPEGMAGYLELLNAVRASQMQLPGYGKGVHPGDTKKLKELVYPVIQKTHDRSGAVGGLGPGALGRARTTEEAATGLRMGMTPEEIAERILQGSKDPALEFAGRYRRGGLARATA